VDFSAQFEKFFDRCPDCGGLGIAKNSGSSPTTCISCRGCGLTLKLPESDLVTSLPLFVNFSGRTKAVFLKFLFLFFASVFIIGVPYVIFVYALGFIKSLSSL
jgi:hypothetical protein